MYKCIQEGGKGTPRMIFSTSKKFKSKKKMEKRGNMPYLPKFGQYIKLWGKAG